VAAIPECASTPAKTPGAALVAEPLLADDRRHDPNQITRGCTPINQHGVDRCGTCRGVRKLGIEGERQTDGQTDNDRNHHRLDRLDHEAELGHDTADLERLDARVIRTEHVE
jgi:hypothetical protein